MRERCETVIVVDVLPSLSLSMSADAFPSPWSVLLKRILPFVRAPQVPSILDIIFSTSLATGKRTARQIVARIKDPSLLARLRGRPAPAAVPDSSEQSDARDPRVLHVES